MPLKRGKTWVICVSREVDTFRNLLQERYREDMDERSSGDLGLSKKSAREKPYKPRKQRLY